MSGIDFCFFLYIKLVVYGSAPAFHARLVPASPYLPLCRGKDCQKAIAAIVIVRSKVSLGIVLSKLDEVFSLFAMMIVKDRCKDKVRIAFAC